MTGRFLAPRGVSVAVLLFATLFLAVGCGGGGSSSRDGDKKGQDTAPVVLGLQTPLGLQGTRGVGPEITVIYRLRDREYNSSDVEIEFGVDANHDGTFDEGSEWFVATEVPNDPANPGTGSSGTDDLAGSPGPGSIHYFVWDSLTDLGNSRYVTQDYVYTDDGRVDLDDFGEPVFQDFPGVRIRIRPISRGAAGAYKETDAFDVNNNNTPSVSIGAVEIPPEGLADNTVNEVVVVNWTAIDPDDDSVTIAVDWVQVPDTFDPVTATLETLEGLPWQASTTGSLGEGTLDLPASRSGLDHQWSWDSVADAGTMNGWILLRMRPLDAQLEVGEWVYGNSIFHLDNYTIFTDPDAALPGANTGGVAVLLQDTSVLYVGGGATEDVATKFAAIFYPGLSQTTKGTIAEIASGMQDARTSHSATRLQDGTVLIVGGRGTAAGALASAEIYDPATKTFTKLTATLGTARRNHTATLLRNGDVLFAGGEDAGGTLLASAELYDAEAGTFGSAGTLVNGARSGAEAVRLPAGRVLIAGGHLAGGATATVEIYDPMAETFLATDVANDLGTARDGLSLTDTLHDPYAAIAAGGMSGTPLNSIEGFDWEMDDFVASAATMRDARANHMAVLLGDGKILFAGGQLDGAGALSPTADIYDVDAESMDVPNGDLVVPVRDATIACLENGRPVMFGGMAAGGATPQVQLFTPDGGFNYPPVAQIRTPTSVEPWAFGVRFNWRATDEEGDPVRINGQFRIKPSGTDDSGSVPPEMLDKWLPATMKDQTVLGEVSSGLTGLSSREDYVTQEANPIDAPDVDPGEHLYVWYTETDIPKGNYDNVFFRIEIAGATDGATATSGRFSITKNAPVIARIDTPLTTSGNVAVSYWLQDSDKGDLARVVWEYGIDLNGDGKIVEADFESWFTCTRATVGVDVNGTMIYDSGSSDLVTGSVDPDPNNEKTADGIPWGKQQYLVWDSVYDIGAPVNPRNDIILRVTPYDYPPGSPGNESLGIDYTVGGFTVEQDPNGLTLESWSPVSNNTPGGGYDYDGVKINEPIEFQFSAPVDITSLTRNSLQITEVGGNGTRMGGFFTVDNSSGKGLVTFYPQVQELPNRSDVLEESTGYAIYIPGYDPSNRGQDIIQRDGADPTDTNDLNILEPLATPSAFQTGTGVLPDTDAPSVDALVEPATFTSVATDTGIEVSFDERILSSSVTANGFLVVAHAFTGVESVVYGALSLRNITENGSGGTVNQYAVLTFTPDGPLPANATTIEIRVQTGLTDLAGNNLDSASTTTFTTATQTSTATGDYVEEFDNAAERDATETSAFWGDTDPNGIGTGGGLGVSGYLTGLHDLGDGSDGTLDWSTAVNNVLTHDTDSDGDTLNLTSLTVPEGYTLRLIGSSPCTIKVLGDVNVEGTIDAAGADGENVVFYDCFNETGGYGAAGGVAGAGGGDGGSCDEYTYKQTTSCASFDGEAGYNAPSTSVGEAGGGTYYYYGGSSYLYYAGGAGGAGHVQAGVKGGDGYWYASKLGGKAGIAWGYQDIRDGLEGGSGGGAGGSVVANYNYPSYYKSEGWGMASGGGGGGGGGALEIAAGGRISVDEAGKILANGGDGGDTHTYIFRSYIFYRYQYYNRTGDDRLSQISSCPGGGGGGSGGTVRLRAGSGFDLHGGIDLSGGEGGGGYYYKYYSYTYVYNDHRGGDGGDGRLVLEGPDTVDLTSAVNFAGCVAAGTSMAISGGTGTADWTVSGSVSINTDTGSGKPSAVTYTAGKFYAKNFTVSSGATLTVTGSRPLIVYASGDVDIAGTIRATGSDAADYGSSGYNYTSGCTGTKGFRAYSRLFGGNGVAGGAKGGENAPSNYTSYVWPPHSGTDGFGTNGIQGGTGGGEGGAPDKDPWVREYGYAYTTYGYQYKYQYWYFGGGGGGGGAAEPGGVGRSMAAWTSVQHEGTPGAGGGVTVDIDTLDANTITGGGGGGGGCQGGYAYNYQYTNTSYTSTSCYYYGYGGNGTAGGGGGGGVMISTSGEMAVSGTIDVSGGEGGDWRYTTSYSGYYAAYVGPGGGGGGGSVLLEAADGFDISSTATIDATGGEGGRCWYKYYATYADYGDNVYSWGGKGARGAVVLRAEKMPEFVNIGNADLGAQGTFDTGTFTLTRDGVSLWQDTGTHAPDFTAFFTTGDGIADLYIEAAQIDPMTGQPDLSTRTGWVAAADLADIDGYRFFRFKCELAGSSVTGKVPEIDTVEVEWESKH